MWNTILVICVVAFCSKAGRLSADWPQWRGPQRDGIVRGVAVPQRWPKALQEVWKVPVGIGWSSPVVVGDKVFVFTRQSDNEVTQCFDLADGKEVWRSEPYAAPYKPGPGNPGDFNPRATPTVAGGRIYTHGITGVLSCLDAKTGKLLWRKDSTRYPTYGASASPLIDDGRCIVHVGGGWPNKGGLTSFDATTGDVKWIFEDWQGPAYGSPILVNLAGERQVVTFRQSSLVGVAASTGKLLWSIHSADFATEKCNTPVLYGDLIIFADNGEPLRAIRLEKGDKGIAPKEVWKATGPKMHMNSPVLSGDRLLGFSGERIGHLFCLDAKTGKTLWRSDGRMGPNASILNAGSVWLVLTSGGQLHILRPSGTEYELIAEYRVSDRQTWAHPVFLGDRVVIKDDTTLRLLRIGEAGSKDEKE